MNVFMAHGAWRSSRSYPIKETLTMNITELEKANSTYEDWSAHKGPWSLIVCFYLDTGYKHLPIIEELVKNRKALLPQDGNCEGWGLSLNSMDEAIALCTGSVKQYEKQKEDKAIAAEKDKEAKRKAGPLFKVLKFNYDGSCFDDANYKKQTMLPSEIVEDIGEIMSSGQGPSDWGYEVMYNGWKGQQISKLFTLLTPDEKRQVWNALNSPEKMEIGTGEGDGSWLECEIEWFAEQLGIKIKVKRAKWSEVNV